MLLKAKTCLHEKQGTHKALPTQHSLEEHSTVKLCGLAKMAIRLCLRFVHTKIFIVLLKSKPDSECQQREVFYCLKNV